MRIFITGAAGYGGSGLTKALLERGHAVTGLDVIAPNHADNLREEIDKGRIIYLWKSTLDVTPQDVADSHIICHFAAQGDVPMCFGSPYWTVFQNALGTVKVLEAAKEAGCEKWILPSSGNVFGRPPKIPIDETCTPICHNVYSASKAAQENLAWAYYYSYGVPIVIYRNGIVYGGKAMRRNIFIWIWLNNILQGKPIVVEGGQQTRDPCYVSDTIDAWVLGIEALPEKVVGEIFQVSRGEEYTIEDITWECMKAAGKEVPIEYKPYRPGEEGMREAFDISKAKRVLGYDPKVSLPEGLRMMVEEMRNAIT